MIPNKSAALTRRGVALCALLLSVGCSDAKNSLFDPPEFMVVGADECSNTVLEAGYFKVIKLGGEGTFRVTVHDLYGTPTAEPSSFSVGAGECAVAYFYDDMWWGKTFVTVEETSGVPDLVECRAVEYGDERSCLEVTPTSAMSRVADVKGVLATFTNPPDTYGEGCTPGYWKQDQHFDSWVDFAPGDYFRDVFGSDVFGDATLFDVLWQGGGGVKALGRHAVAALLNTASGDVDYGMSADGVINAFVDALAQGKVQIESLKDQLAEGNEAGCPLD